MDDEYDGPWKAALEGFLPELLALLHPTLYADVDWTVEPLFLDGELQKIAGTADRSGVRRTDKLVRLMLVSGAMRLVLLHVEVQASSQAEFAERMFDYFARIWCHMRAGGLEMGQLVCLAILADDDPDWQPGRFDLSAYGTELAFGFRTAKLLDFVDHVDALEADGGPAALIVLAYLATRATRGPGRVDQRFSWKLRLMRRLCAAGYDRRRVGQLFVLIDWLLKLPPELVTVLYNEIDPLEEKAMRPHSIIDDIGIDVILDRWERLKREREERIRQEGEDAGRAAGEAISRSADAEIVQTQQLLTESSPDEALARVNAALGLSPLRNRVRSALAARFGLAGVDLLPADIRYSEAYLTACLTAADTSTTPDDFRALTAPYHPEPSR